MKYVFTRSPRFKVHHHHHHHRHHHHHHHYHHHHHHHNHHHHHHHHHHHKLHFAFMTNRQTRQNYIPIQYYAPWSNLQGNMSMCQWLCSAIESAYSVPNFIEIGDNEKGSSTMNDTGLTNFSLHQAVHKWRRYIYIDQIKRIRWNANICKTYTEYFVNEGVVESNTPWHGHLFCFTWHYNIPPTHLLKKRTPQGL